MIDRVNSALQAVSDWTDANMVTVNATKTEPNKPDSDLPRCICAVDRQPTDTRCGAFIQPQLWTIYRVYTTDCSKKKLKILSKFRRYLTPKQLLQFNCIKHKFGRVWNTDENKRLIGDRLMAKAHGHR